MIVRTIHTLLTAIDRSLAAWSRGETPTDDDAAELGFAAAEADQARRILVALDVAPDRLHLAMDAARYFRQPLADMAELVGMASHRPERLRRVGFGSIDELRAAVAGMAAAYATTGAGQAEVRAARRSLEPR